MMMKRAYLILLSVHQVLPVPYHLTPLVSAILNFTFLLCFHESGPVDDRVMVFGVGPVVRGR